MEWWGSFVGAWTALAATFGAVVAWLGFRIARLSMDMDFPHLFVHHYRGDQKVYFGLDGPRARDCCVTRVKLAWLTRNQLLKYETSFSGEPVIETAEPQGRVLNNPLSPLLLAELPSGMLCIEFTVAPKSNPKRARRFVRRINVQA